jgi:rhomboid family GlyGly-CTERM serine protease
VKPRANVVQRHGGYTLPWRTFILVALALSLFVLGGPASQALVFDREAILHGELWRLLTGHWVHGDTEHLFWNVMALGILGAMVELTPGQMKLGTALLGGTALVDVWLWWFMPGLDFYCGLSGILNTLLFLVLIDGWRRTGSTVFPLVLLGATAKIAVETTWATALFTHTAWPAVPPAHLAGALAGVLLTTCRHSPKMGMPVAL